MGNEQARVGAVQHAVLVAIPVVLAMAVGVACSGDDDGDAGATTTAPVEDIEMQADDFVPLRDMTPVRGFSSPTRWATSTRRSRWPTTPRAACTR